MAKPVHKGLVLRKRADREQPQRDDGSWELLGLEVVGEPHSHARIPTSTVKKGLSEGWIELEGMRFAFYPGGPAEQPDKVTHEFVHADAIILKTLDGDVRYRVTHQPAKYVGDSYTEATAEHAGDPDTRVDHFYDAELEG